MKTELRAAITQLSAERNLPKEVVLTALESALASAYKKDVSALEQDVLVKVNPNAVKSPSTKLKNFELQHKLVM